MSFNSLKSETEKGNKRGKDRRTGSSFQHHWFQQYKLESVWNYTIIRDLSLFHCEK